METEKEMKRWTSNSGMIRNQSDTIIASVLDNCTREEENIILLAPVAINAIKKFVSKSNSRNFRLRSEIKKLEQIVKFSEI